MLVFKFFQIRIIYHMKEWGNGGKFENRPIIGIGTYIGG